LVVGHCDREAFDISRRTSLDAMLASLERAGVDHAGFRSILDFGCGCGRMLAGWEDRLPSAGARLHGCDLHPKLVAFCQNNIPHADVVQSSAYPPLPYRDEQFDFIYACSVYTHMTLPAMLQWTGEFARILQPGGIIILTTHGSYFTPTLANLSRSGSAHLAEHGWHVHVHGRPDATWEGVQQLCDVRVAGFPSPAVHRLRRGGNLSWCLGRSGCLCRVPGHQHFPTAGVG
jgi:SAM-dependent methyltransferase